MAEGRKTGGRRPGSLNKATTEARIACAELVDDPECRLLGERLRAGTLSPAVELWHYAKAVGSSSVLTFVVTAAALLSATAAAAQPSSTSYVVTDGVPGSPSGSVFRVSPNGSVTLLATTVGHPNGIAVAGNGDFYVTIPFRREVVRITPTGAVLLFFSGGPLLNPGAILVDRGGNIVVADNNRDAVYRITPDGSSISTLLTLPRTPTSAQDMALALDPAGNVVVASDDIQDVGPSQGSTIVRIEPGGGATTLFVGQAIVSSAGLVIEPSGDMVIPDYRQNALLRLTPAGRLSVIAQGPQLCCNLVGLARDPVTGDFISLINFADRIVRITRGGAVSTVYGGLPLTFPHEIAALPSAGGSEQAPGAPTNLQVNISGSTVTLNWNAPASGGAPASYVLEAGTASGASNVVFDTGNSSTTFMTTGVPANTYFVRIRARNSAGTSAPSNEVLLLVGGSAVPCGGPPGTPSGLTAQVNGQSVSLTWNAPNGPVTSYVIEAGSAPGLSDLAVVDTGSALTSLAATAAPGTYYVRIRGKNSCGTGGSSNEVSLVVSASR